MEDNIIVEK